MDEQEGTNELIDSPWLIEWEEEAPRLLPTEDDDEPDLKEQACQLYNRLVVYSQAETTERRRALDAIELAHDALIRYLRRAGHSQYLHQYRASETRYRFRAGRECPRRTT